MTCDCSLSSVAHVPEYKAAAYSTYSSTALALSTQSTRGSVDDSRGTGAGARMQNM